MKQHAAGSSPRELTGRLCLGEGARGWGRGARGEGRGAGGRGAREKRRAARNRGTLSAIASSRVDSFCSERVCAQLAHTPTGFCLLVQSLCSLARTPTGFCLLAQGWSRRRLTLGIHVATEAQVVAFETVQKIFDLTTEIFGDDVSVKSSHDPEYPSETYTVLSPQVSADNPTILRMESEWVERVARLAPNGHGFRLRIRRKE